MPKLPDFPPRSGLPEGSILPPSGLGRFDAASASLLDRSGPILDPLAFHKKLLSQQKASGAAAGGLSPAVSGAASLLTPTSVGPSLLNAAGSTTPSPSLYEMAALTHELDTQAVTTKVKEILLANNVGQKVRSNNSPLMTNVAIFISLGSFSAKRCWVFRKDPLVNCYRSPNRGTCWALRAENLSLECNFG